MHWTYQCLWSRWTFKLTKYLKSTFKQTIYLINTFFGNCSEYTFGCPCPQIILKTYKVQVLPYQNTNHRVPTGTGYTDNIMLHHSNYCKQWHDGFLGLNTDDLLIISEVQLFWIIPSVLFLPLRSHRLTIHKKNGIKVMKTPSPALETGLFLIILSPVVCANPPEASCEVR